MPVRTPTISIGLPVYNGEKYLRDALDSILGQSFSDFQIIAYDNSSTDATVPILEEYAARDARVKVYRNATNIGSVANFNRALESAAGKYFMWWAHDDIMECSYLTKCFSFLESNLDYVLCCARSTFIDADGVDYECSIGNLSIDDDDPAIRLEKLLDTPFLALAFYGLMRCDVLKRMRLTNRPVLTSDQVFLGELVLVGKFHQMPEVLTCYRYTSAARRLAGEAERSLAKRRAYMEIRERQLLPEGSIGFVFPLVNCDLALLAMVARSSCRGAPLVKLVRVVVRRIQPVRRLAWDLLGLLHRIPLGRQPATALHSMCKAVWTRRLNR